MTHSQFSQDDLHDLTALLEQAAAEQIMPRFQRLATHQVHEKSSSFDIVTDADQATESWLTDALAQRFPTAIVIGEEAASLNPSLLDSIQSAELAFIVDPLDGTKNFASGLPLFGCMIGVVEHGEVVAGVIHDPVTRSSARALVGHGAWMHQHDGTRHRLHVAEPVPLNQIQAIAGTNFLPEPTRTQVNRNLSQLMMTNWFRCSAHEYRLAAAGHMHVLFYNKLMPWDHAAGWLLHREAGGYSAHFDGTPYRPFDLTGGLLCAPDESSWFRVRNALFSDAAPP